MTIDQLETLEAIVDKGSFKAAAEFLNKTQPSLSVAIKKLEQEFDLQIFNRDEYRPKLTPEGKIFYNWAKQSLYSFRELQTVGKELGSKKIEPFLTLAIDPLVRFEAIEGICEETLLGKYPTEVTFRSEIMSRGQQLLLAGEVDFSISAQTSDEEKIESVLFDKIKMIPVVSKILAKKMPVVSYQNLQKFPQIVVIQQNDNRDIPHGERYGVITDSRKSLVTDHSLKHKMILNGFGWGRLPESEIQAELKKGTLLEINDGYVSSFDLEIHIMRLKRKPMGPVAKAIWSKLLKNAEAFK